MRCALILGLLFAALTIGALMVTPGATDCWPDFPGQVEVEEEKL